MSLGSIENKAKGRTIGTIVADITIVEESTDELVITEHPVEQGAAITDHAYKRPAMLTLRVAWSNSSPQAGGNEGYVTQVYQQLLKLQKDRAPIDIVTGQRSYSDMLIRSLSKTTDETTENALFITMGCQQIITVSTTTTTTVPPADLHASPAQTSPVSNTGVKQAVPAALSPPFTPVPGITMSP